MKCGYFQISSNIDMRKGLSTFCIGKESLVRCFLDFLIRNFAKLSSSWHFIVYKCQCVALDFGDTIRSQTGQMGPNVAKWSKAGLIFCMQAYFYAWKISCLSNTGIQTKIGQAMGMLLVPRFWSSFTKNWKLISMALFWAMALINLVPPSW